MKKNSSKALPITDTITRNALVKELRKTYDVATAMIAQICMSTGMPPADVLQLTYNDIPEKGPFIVEGIYLYGRPYPTILPSDVLTTIKSMRQFHEPTDYIFISNKRSKNGEYEPMQVNTFSHKVAVALKNIGIDTTEHRYSAKSLQVTYFYDVYTCHGAEYVQTLTGHRNLQRVYDFLQVDRSNEVYSIVNGVPEIICESRLEECKIYLEKLEKAMLSATHSVSFYKECTYCLEQVSALLEKMTHIETKLEDDATCLEKPAQ